MKQTISFLAALLLLASMLLLSACSAGASDGKVPSQEAGDLEAGSQEADDNTDSSGSQTPHGSQEADGNTDSSGSQTIPSIGTDAGTDGASGLQAAPSASGPLQVSGTQLCDSAGNPVQLKGISTHGLAWFPDYVNEECFADFKNNWNANVIRLAMYTAESGGYCTGGDQAQLKELVRKGIQYAASQGLYVIVDWHILSDNNPNTYLSEAKDFFQEISSEFSGETHILYEICNEPNGNTRWSEIKSYALEVIPMIRANDPDAVILVGTPNWSQYVDQAAADPITEYDNLMYALHFYAATHKEGLRNQMAAAITGGLPVFVTEYGICDASGNGGLDLGQADQWIAAMDQYGVSYVAWNLSNKNESSALLKSSCTKTSGFTQEDLSDFGQWLYQMLTAGTGSLPASGHDREAADGARDSQAGQLHISCKDYNGSIPAGGSIDNIGFIVSGGKLKSPAPQRDAGNN